MRAYVFATLLTLVGTACSSSVTISGNSDGKGGTTGPTGGSRSSVTSLGGSAQAASGGADSLATSGGTTGTMSSSTLTLAQSTGGLQGLGGSTFGLAGGTSSTSVATHVGGAATGGTASAVATGGYTTAASGGTTPAATGGTIAAATGGAATGGAATGGTIAAASGGTTPAATGGTIAAATGGAVTGGAATGGTTATATGGAATGGTTPMATGGVATGGTSSAAICADDGSADSTEFVHETYGCGHRFGAATSADYWVKFDSGLHYDKKTGYGWLDMAGFHSQSEGAIACAAQTVGGITTWQLPTIGQVRTLTDGCPETSLGGICRIGDTCLASACGTDAQCTSCLGQGGPGPDNDYVRANVQVLSYTHTTSMCADCSPSSDWVYLQGNGNYLAMDSTYLIHLACVSPLVPSY